jgi:hypothetical protein
MASSVCDEQNLTCRILGRENCRQRWTRLGITNKRREDMKEIESSMDDVTNNVGGCSIRCNQSQG